MRSEKEDGRSEPKKENDEMKGAFSRVFLINIFNHEIFIHIIRARI